MGTTRLEALLLVVLLCVISGAAGDRQKPGRNPNQSIDEEYTRKIHEYTTETFFSSPLVDYMPASENVPTPKVVLGDIAGAPGMLPYSAEVYRYMRMLDDASARVKVFSIGTTEEGREMIAVAVASEKLIAGLDENRVRLGKLADPRTIGMNDSEADRIVEASVPVYYITGGLHSRETGAPTALMELTYRLAVDESAYIEAIRDGVVTLITPIVEVDGWDRNVDIYRRHVALPEDNWTSLMYWGKNVAHDNNRDAMGLTLQLSRNVLATFLRWKAQVIHDLHESVPYLYDNTIGDGPYNPWIDPILTDEWQMIGWNNVSEMTKFGMPGVFAHGYFDTWSPGYLMFMAASHNGISRLYETFGNGGADTVERTLSPGQYSRTWYRQNPPLPKTMWSQRNNNNYQQTGLLTALSYFAENRRLFLKNFYLKSRRSIEKPDQEGPAAYVFPADDPRPGGQAELLRLLQLQGCEISRATSPFSATVKAKRNASKEEQDGGRSEGSGGRSGEKSATETREFAAGSYVVRMDQPYSRIADMLLDHQYWSPTDPQQRPFDDTGWTFGELGNVKVIRVTDKSVLQAPMDLVADPVRPDGGVEGDGAVFVIDHNTDLSLMTLRYRLKDAPFDVAEEPFEARGRKFGRGSFIIRNTSRAELGAAAEELGVRVHAMNQAPQVKSHPARAARIAILHTWLSTQTEGWWRIAFDEAKIPYAYISTQTVAQEEDLKSKYDVILFPPVGRGGGQAIITGLPMWRNPLPWKTTPETPNIGKIDSTDDVRPGLGWGGLENLHHFVRAGGLLVCVMDTADWAATYGFTPGVSTSRSQKFKAIGTVVRSKRVDQTSPIAYGYGDDLSIFCSNGPIFNLSNTVGGRGGRRGPGSGSRRATGRGTPDEQDIPQGRPAPEIPDTPSAKPWQTVSVTDEQMRNGINVIPPEYRPRVVLRYADGKELLVSGLLDGGGEIAQHAAVVDIPVEKGHVVLFSNNPIWRGETQGSYFLVFNAILNFDNLDAGRTLDKR